MPAPTACPSPAFVMKHIITPARWDAERSEKLQSDSVSEVVSSYASCSDCDLVGLQLFKDDRVSLAGHNEDPLDYRRKGASDFWITRVCRRCVSQPSLGLVVSVAMGAEPQEVESDGTESNKEE